MWLQATCLHDSERPCRAIKPHRTTLNKQRRDRYNTQQIANTADTNHQTHAHQRIDMFQGAVACGQFQSARRQLHEIVHCIGREQREQQRLVGPLRQVDLDWRRLGRRRRRSCCCRRCSQDLRHRVEARSKLTMKTFTINKTYWQICVFKRFAPTTLRK